MKTVATASRAAALFLAAFVPLWLLDRFTAGLAPLGIWSFML